MSTDHVAISEVLELSDAGVWGPDADHDGISILRSTNFRADGEISFDNLAIKEIAKKDKTRKLLLPGDILVEKSGGGPKQPVGRVVFFRGSPRPHVFGNFIARLRTKQNICDPKFLFWFLHVGHKRGVTENFQKQTTGIRNLEFKRFLGQQIPLPPLDEQRRIVGLLDRAAEIRRRADAARAKARAIIPALFLDTFGDPAANPKGWPVVTVGDLRGVELRNGISPSKTGKVIGNVLTLSAITRGSFDPNARKESTFAGSLAVDQTVSRSLFLICRGNGNRHLVGQGAFPTSDMPGVAFPDTMIALRILESEIAPSYLAAVWSSAHLRAQIDAAAKTTNGTFKISQSAIVRFSFPLPPPELQTAFAEQAHRLESLTHHLDAAAAKAEAIVAGLSAEVFA